MTRVRFMDKSLWITLPRLTICIGLNTKELFFFELSRDFFGLTLLSLDLRVNWDKNQEVVAKWALNQTKYHLPEILKEVERDEQR